LQTRFSAAQLADPATAESEGAIRKCVHCGFCLSTCPTYVLLGDELDSPRGRIYLMKDMLENALTPSAAVVKHVDRCLSCLSCVTACPSGVDYRRLVDHARDYIERHHRRSLSDRAIRALIAWSLPHRRRFRAMARLGRLARPLSPLFQRVPGLKPLAAMLTLAPDRLPSPAPAEPPPTGAQRGRVILLEGCVEAELAPQIRAAAARLLARAGYAVSTMPGEGCCGALVHHMGREAAAHAQARRNLTAWRAEIDRGEVVAILATASGCGSQIKDYGHLLAQDPAWAGPAAKVSALAKDLSELLDGALPQATGAARGLRVAYQSPCSLRHGQKVRTQPRTLLEAAGFSVSEPAEAHLCCGSAGTYNILQPELSGQLLDRKLANIAALKPEAIATSNIGCQTQLARRARVPVVHIAELLDWATGGPKPAALP
jgi:glycolate oxidase iron-sulfur subunit